MLEIQEISKAYGNKQVLSGVDLKLEHGVYGLLGRNGAGKTTLIHIITGILRPDAGSILYHGENILKKKTLLKKNLGYMPQYATYYPDFTAREFLEYIHAAKGIKEKEGTDEILERVNLTQSADARIGTFSGGMRQRLGIAQALLGNPEVLILDEPTAGLDPAERIRFRNLISELGDKKTVIFATHIVQDVEHIANRVIFLHEGRVLLEGSPKELLNGMEGKVGLTSEIRNGQEAGMPPYVVSNMFYEDGSCTLRVVADELPAGIERVAPNLEDMFLLYTDGGKNGRADSI